MKTPVHISLHTLLTHVGEQQVLIYWFWAMTQFILLSLLLAATIQLPLVSVTDVWLRRGKNITFKFPQGCSSVRCCKGENCKNAAGNGNLPGVTVTRCDLTINNLERGDHYHCHYDPHTSDLHLWKRKGYEYSHLHGVAFLGNQLQRQDKCTEQDCRKRCTGDSNCKYFTFDKKNKKCFLIKSRDNLEIEFNTQYVSGYPCRVSCKCPKVSGAGAGPGPSGAAVTVERTDDVVHLQYHQDAKSWIDALEYCQDRKSSLVEICSDAVQDAMNKLLQNKTNSMQDGVWIGLERSIFGRKGDHWKWISGSEVEDQTQWNSSDFVDPFNNHCGKIIWVEESKKFKWLDAYCHEKLPFICRDLSRSCM